MGLVVATPTAMGVHMGVTGVGQAQLTLAAIAQAQSCNIIFTSASAAIAAGSIVYNNVNGFMSFTVAGVECMRLFSTGRMALGTTAAESCLQVAGALVSTNPTLAGCHLGMASATTPGIILCATSNAVAPYIQFTYAGYTYPAKISFDLVNSIFTFDGGSGAVCTMQAAGFSGFGGVTSPKAPIHVAGKFPSTGSMTTGVLMGLEYAITPIHAKLAMVCASTSASCYLDFAYSGQSTLVNSGVGAATTNACQARIAYSMSSGHLQFYTKQNSTSGVAMIIDGGTANQTLLIGTNAPQASYKLYVNGAMYATTASASVKSFDIPNEGKGGCWRLRHRVLESPQAGVVYHFKLDCQVGETTLELPDYYSWLATDPIVHVTPFRHFGVGWGDVDAAGQALTVTVNQAGSYRVTLFATRNDAGSREEFDEFGTEYETDCHQEGCCPAEAPEDSACK